MKKIVLLLYMLSVYSAFISCGDIDNTDVSDPTEIIESDITDYEDTFTTIDELGYYILENKDGYFKNLFEHKTQKSNSSALTVYELANIPDDFYLSEIRKVSYGQNISMYHKNDMTGEQITFVWYFAWDGDEYLKNSKTGYDDITGMPGYYYTKVNDDNNIEIYQILWAEDGYCFQLNIPVKIFDEKFKDEGFIELEKIEFPISDQFM